MEKRVTTKQYFTLPETNRPAELIHGVVREPPAPVYGHQQVVGDLFHVLKAHVDAHGLGHVCVSPIDVVLDEAAALVVQPDVIFISNDRASIIQNFIAGAPDLVVEVMSPHTAYRDRTIKLAWYRRYGVRECWLADPLTRCVDVIDGADGSSESFTGGQVLRSRVLPGLTAPAGEYFPATIRFFDSR